MHCLLGRELDAAQLSCNAVRHRPQDHIAPGSLVQCAVLGDSIPFITVANLVPPSPGPVLKAQDPSSGSTHSSRITEITNDGELFRPADPASR